MATNSRERVLGAIRNCQLPQIDLPDLQQDWTTYADPVDQFCQSLQAVGGRAIVCKSPTAWLDELAKLEVYQAATDIGSLMDGVAKANLDLAVIDDPHQLASLDLMILPGAFAVAENGAVWLNGRSVKHRACYFICQHLALVVPMDQIVDNMHQAYDRLSFEEAEFGLFLSGPSKTADIEQSLVIGAHGARSLIVFLVPTV